MKTNLLLTTLTLLTSMFVVTRAVADGFKVEALRPVAILPVTQQSGTHGQMSRCEFTVDRRFNTSNWSETIFGVLIHGNDPKALVSAENFAGIGIVALPNLPLSPKWSANDRQNSGDDYYHETSYDGSKLRAIVHDHNSKSIYQVVADAELKFVQEISYVSYDRDQAGRWIEKLRVICAPPDKLKPERRALFTDAANNALVSPAIIAVIDWHDGDRFSRLAIQRI